MSRNSSKNSNEESKKGNSVIDRVNSPEKTRKSKFHIESQTPGFGENFHLKFNTTQNSKSLHLNEDNYSKDFKNLAKKTK